MRLVGAAHQQPHNNMMKQLVALFALVTTITTLSAQTYIGFRGGVNFANQEVVINDDDNDTDVDELNLIGFAVQVPITTQLTDIFGLETSISYMQRGSVSNVFEIQTPSFSGDVDTETKISYLGLNVFPYVNIGKRFGLYAGAGFGADYALDGEVKVEGEFGGTTIDDENPIDFDQDGFNRFDVNFQLGAGIALPLGEKSRFVFDARYALGLLDIQDDNNDNLDIRNRGLSLTVGVQFPLSR